MKGASVRCVGWERLKDEPKDASQKLCPKVLGRMADRLVVYSLLEHNSMKD